MKKSTVTIVDGKFKIDLNENDTEELEQVGFCPVEFNNDLYFVIRTPFEDFYLSKAIDNWSSITMKK